MCEKRPCHSVLNHIAGKRKKVAVKGGERKNKEKQKPLTQGKNVHKKTQVHMRKGPFLEKRDFKIYRKPKKY